MRMPPVPAPMPAVSPLRLTVNGNPVWYDRIPESWMSPNILDVIFWLCGTGRSYRKVLIHRCALWKDARLLSAARLNESCGGEFSLPLTPPALRNCGALVIDFDHVYELKNDTPLRNRRSRRANIEW